jgi:hypothetical protein
MSHIEYISMETEKQAGQNPVVDIRTVEIESETFFMISNHHLMRPFLMNVVSDANHWMYILSNGGITAGRKNPEFALFPYYTEDKLAEFAEITGSKSIFQISSDTSTFIWEPFSEREASKFSTSRNLYKNVCGNKIIFEEINHDLGISFRTQWNSSNLFGFVKKAEFINHSGQNYKVYILDGIQNIMPHGVSSYLQTAASNLVDGYKRNELHVGSGLGIFALSAIISDKAEPSESLKANIAWSIGLDKPKFLLSSLQLDRFRNLKPVHPETDIKGEKGAYFVCAELVLPPNTSKKWKIIANVNQDQSQVIGLCQSILQDADLAKKLDADIAEGTQNLMLLLAQADGLQYTADQFKDARHLSNVLFNIMRGGIFDNHYQIEKHDFSSYLANANKIVYQTNQSFIKTLQAEFSQSELEGLLSDCGDADLIRLGKEYLPLKFSRRHGDPSRPWNKFSINSHSEIDGSKILDYEGNWRDIFQNWEALVHSFPGFIEGMIFKFLNASTFDGYNPYRVTKGGFDWEVIEHDNPWSFIGYWGDHQIIYLLKFLEFAHQKDTQSFSRLLESEQMVYAHVPYRIKTYNEILLDPKNTIDFDEQADLAIRQKIREIGADGALLGSTTEAIYHVNFLEKILATILSKSSNYIPGAGIWMNTQRPEWNDANNALVGNGVSMVTLCYLRRFFMFIEKVFDGSGIEQTKISSELVTLFTKIAATFENHQSLPTNHMSNQQRRAMVDALGQAGSDYRETIYNHGFSGRKETLNLSELSKFIRMALHQFQQTIAANCRVDNLYHAYNLLTIHPSEGMSVDRLSEMLEGQVAVLSSGALSSEEKLHLLDSLRTSALYRADQNSYLLYPNKELPGFLEKNFIPLSLVEQSELLLRLVKDNNHQVILKDVNDNYHFNGNFRNARDLDAALSELTGSTYHDLVDEERTLILQIFEKVFNHKSFTGRSGTFYAYEGLGSIYWHMVSKLYLAVQEACLQAVDEQANQQVIDRLLTHFYDIGDGIGIHKSPEKYGAFPTDPYSHTPLHRGAQQPGMTGQVKEDILVRFAELGVLIQDGKLCFKPAILRKSEFVKQGRLVHFLNVKGEQHYIQLGKDSLGFSICQVSVVYEISDKQGIQVEISDGSRHYIDGFAMDQSNSNEIFNRTGRVASIHVFLKEQQLRG